MSTALGMSKSMPVASGSLPSPTPLWMCQLTRGKNSTHAVICGMLGGGGGIVCMKTYAPAKWPPPVSVTSFSARPVLSVVPLLSTQCSLLSEPV